MRSDRDLTRALRAAAKRLREDRNDSRALRAETRSLREDRELAGAVGSKIQGLRIARKLTLGRLAEMAGIHPRALASFEEGRRLPNPVAVVKILRALGYSWEDFGKALESPELLELFSDGEVPDEN